jgi:hypothetical protein
MSSHPDLMGQSGALWTVYNRILVAAGVPADRLARIRKVIFTFVFGFLAAETGGFLAALDGVDDADATFEAATDLITAALEGSR